MDDTTDGPQYYLFDTLGSVVGLSRPDGSLQSRTQYDAWGQTQATRGHSANRLGFTGHERDVDSGLYYAKARYYDPALESFLSTDPATADLMNPPSFHPYLYAYANPTVYRDPDGQQSVSTLIDQAAEGCGALACAGYALLKGTYHATTFGFATVHDPVRDAYDHGRVTGSEYLTYGVGGGLAAVGVNVAASATGGAAAGVATTAVGRVLVSGGVGAIAAAADDALQQGTQLATGLQAAYQPGQTVQAAAIGFAAGSATTAVAEGIAGLRASRVGALTDDTAQIQQVTESPRETGGTRTVEPPPTKEGFGPYTKLQGLPEEGTTKGIAFTTDKIRFSQNSVSFSKIDRATGQAYTYDDLVANMRANGWKGEPVDAVRMPDGRLTSIDNTRIRAAREAGINVQTNVRSFDSPLTSEEIGRFTKGSQIPSTWGDAITIRINNQTGDFGVKYPYGADPLPRVTGRPK